MQQIYEATTNIMPSTRNLEISQAAMHQTNHSTIYAQKNADPELIITAFARPQNDEQDLNLKTIEHKNIYTSVIKFQ